jgi:hypothetical protein
MNQASHTQPQWLDMRRQDMDAAEPLTLFDVTPDLDLGAAPKPDPCGTPDMFADAP